MIRAILRAQLLSLRPGKGVDRRGAILSLVTAVVWYGFWCFAAAATFEYCKAAPATELPIVLRTGLFVVFVYWQVAPVATATMGAGLDMRKLLVYPIPHAQLFQIEVLLRLFSGAEMLLVVAGGVAGLLAGPAGSLHAAPRVLTATILFVLFNALVASGLRSILQRLLARGRVREVLVLVGVTALVLPRLLALTGIPLEWAGELIAMRKDGLPWTLGAQALSGEAPLASLFGLCAWSALGALFGRWQFERSLRFDAAAAQASDPGASASRAVAWTERFYRFPARVLRDPLAAIVEKELRTLSRSPRFRMVFVMGFSFGLMVWLPLIIGGRADRASALSENFLVIVTVYALTLLGQVSYWNSFGFDRSAAQIYYFAPQPIRRVILAKNLAALVFIYLEAALLIAVTFAFPISITPARLAETIVVLSICSLYMLALGNISSVEYPRPLTPERVSQGGASSRFQALIFLLYPLALIPVFLAYFARYVLSSVLVFWALVAIAGLIGAIVYWIALDSSANSAVRRREHILQELARGDGPVAAN